MIVWAILMWCGKGQVMNRAMLMSLQLPHVETFGKTEPTVLQALLGIIGLLKNNNNNNFYCFCIGLQPISNVVFSGNYQNSRGIQPYIDTGQCRCIRALWLQKIPWIFCILHASVADSLPLLFHSNATTFQCVSSGCENISLLQLQLLTFFPTLCSHPPLFPQRLSPDSQSSCNISASLVFPQLSCHLHDSLECFLSRNSIYSLCFNTANAFPLLEPLCLFSVNELSFSLYGYFL